MAFLRPSFIDSMSWEMAEVYGAITDQILVNLARYFPYWKSSNVPKSAFEYQAAMLAQMGQVNKDTIRIIRNGLKGANGALTNVLEQAVMEAVKKAQPELLKGVKQGLLKPAGIPIVDPEQSRAFQLYYQQAANKLNLVNTVMLESTKQAYQATVSDIVSRVQATQTALDIGAGEVATGVSSWNQALRHSIDRMKANGITGFIDHGGHRWSAEAYTAMDIRTTVANTARAAVWETNQNFGNDLYLVSYHQGARPLCYPWQNKVISANDRSGVTYDLDGNEIEIIPQRLTSYGEPAGLFGINCKHYPTPFIPGVSLIRGEPQDPEANAKTYEESQKQRALEREIREQKRDLLMMKAQGASNEEIKAQRARIRETDDRIDEFCKETGRARRQSREGAFTQRSFPDPDTYDVTTFKNTQKDLVDDYFRSGGVQKDYTFKQMTPKEPITPTTPVAPVKPITPTVPKTPTTPQTPAPQNVAPQATPQTPNVVKSDNEKSELLKRLEGWKNVETREVQQLKTPLTEKEIIAKVSGADQTKGSCASVAWTYAGNKNGYDVLDFRDGESRALFAQRSTSYLVTKLDGVTGWIVEEGNDFKGVHELYKNMVEGKEYYLATGGHASIIRKVGEGYEYLELQANANYSGWHTLDDTALRYRFGCKRSHSSYGMKFKIGNVLVDIETLKNNRDFETMLTYINTAAGSQRKGFGGGIK